MTIGAAPSFPQSLLACLALGILLSSKCLLQMAFPHFPTPRWMDTIAGVMAFLVASLLGVDALDNGGVPLTWPPLFFVLPTLGLGATFVAVHRWMSLLHARGRQLSSRPIAWLTVALSLAATAWSSYRYTDGNLKIQVEQARYFIADGELEAAGEFMAMTDRGRELKLHRWKPNEGNRTAAHLPALADSSPANCHGWVFTAGKYYVDCDDVERILEDNGYKFCQSPLPGDLIVYRSPSGAITHTGLVQTVYLGGMVVIDSKWGFGARFIHGPEQQPYGNLYSYYRSSRQGHALAIVPARPVMSIASR